MSNIRVLDTRAKAKAEVVEMAESILAKAKSGEIVDLCYAVANADGSISSSYTPTDDAPRRLAAVWRLFHRLNEKITEDSI